MADPYDEFLKALEDIANPIPKAPWYPEDEEKLNEEILNWQRQGYDDEDI